MEADEIKLQLLRSPDDPPLESEEYQKSLRNFHESLRANGYRASVTVRTMDAVAGVPAIFTGVFGVVIDGLPIVSKLASAWIKSHPGGRVLLQAKKNGDIKAEARTVEEIEQLFKMVRKKPRERKPTRL